jgi:hypothetical protein
MVFNMFLIVYSYYFLRHHYINSWSLYWWSVVFSLRYGLNYRRCAFICLFRKVLLTLWCCIVLWLRPLSFKINEFSVAKWFVEYFGNVYLAEHRTNRRLIGHHHHHHHWFDSPTWALAFLRTFYQLKYPAIASSDFVKRVFSTVGLSTPRPTTGYPGGPMFSVRVVSLSWLVPILKRQDLALCLCMT